MNDHELKELVNKREVRIGDHVRIKYGGYEGSLQGFDNGEECRVYDVFTHHKKKRCELHTDDGRIGYAYLDQLEVPHERCGAKTTHQQQARTTHW